MKKLTHPSWLSMSNATTNFYIIGGITVTLIWLALFVAGLHINSSYYRTAIMYGFADWQDWLMAISTFTLSNVALLSFYSGLLGGIISKVSATEGFRRTYDELKADKTISAATYENPFISAFRGVFIFLGILSVQYLSSFSDLNAISAAPTVPEKQVMAIDQSRYAELFEKVKDSSTRQEIINIWKQAPADKAIANDSDSLSVLVKKLKDSLVSINEMNTPRSRNLEAQIHAARLKIKAPPNSELAFMSSSSYFKFAVIVSLLSFVCGYDPSRFTSLLNQIPIALGKNGKAKDNTGGKDA
jgi:hypothetical protein